MFLKIVGRVGCSIAALGLIGAAITRQWITDGYPMSLATGLLKTTVHSDEFWNTRFIEVAHDMGETGRKETLFVVAGILTTMLSVCAALTLIATLVSGSRHPRVARRLSTIVQLMLFAAIGGAATFVYTYPMDRVVLSWSLLAFVIAVPAGLASAQIVRRSILRDPRDLGPTFE